AGAERGADSASRHQPPVRGDMHPTDDVDANVPMAGLRRAHSQNSEQSRDVGAREAGALCRPGRSAEEEKKWSGGVSDPAPALFGPLRAGSLTPTCLVSVVRQNRPGCVLTS